MAPPPNVRRLRLKRLFLTIESICELAAWRREEMDYLCQTRYSNAGERNYERRSL